jgi:hypothetical protein
MFAARFSVLCLGNNTVTAKEHLADGASSFVWKFFCFVVVIAGNFFRKFLLGLF